MKKNKIFIACDSTSVSKVKEIIKMLNEKTGTNYVYSRDLIENKDEEQIDLFPTYEGGHSG